MRVPVVFIITSWQEAGLSWDGKGQELSSISIFPSKLPVKLFCFLPPIFTFLAEGCTVPAALSGEGEHLEVKLQSRAVKAQSLSAGDLDKTPAPKDAVFIQMAGAVWQEKFLPIPVLEEELLFK